MFYYFYEVFFEKALERTVSMGFTDVYREAIIETYIARVSYSLSDFMFGVKLEGELVFEYFAYNLHNSYLKLHSLHGIIGLIAVLISIIITQYKFFVSRNFLYCGMLMVILVRISTDIAAFQGPFDPLIYYFILMALCNFTEVKQSDFLVREYKRGGIKLTN